VLTAACVAVGRYTAIGDQHGGYFFLPPWNAWAAWAQNEIEVQRHRIDSIDVWVNGRRFNHGEALPKAHNKACRPTSGATTVYGQFYDEYGFYKTMVESILRRSSPG
jgi:hypothetical protein